MKRREFITLLGGAAGAWPVAAQAQQADHAGGLVYLALVRPSRAHAAFVAAFRNGLNGIAAISKAVTCKWSTVGRTISMIGCLSLAAELVRHPVSVIVASGRPGRTHCCKGSNFDHSNCLHGHF